MKIELSKHGKDRLKQRKKLPKSIKLVEDVRKAWYRGITKKKACCELGEYLERYDGEIRVYQGFVYLFNYTHPTATLITIVYLPKKLL